MTPEQKARLAELRQKRSQGLLGRVESAPEAREDNFFIDAVKDINQGVTRAGDAIAGGLNDAVGAYKQTQTGERNPIKGGFDMAGNLVRGGSETLGELFMGGAKATVTDDTEKKVGDFVQEKADDLINTPLAQDIKAKYDSLTPDQKQDAATVTNLVMGVLDGVGFKGGSLLSRGVMETLDTATDVTKQVVKNTADKTGGALSVAGNVAGDVAQGTGEFVTSQVTGLNADTLKTIFKNPDAYKEAVDEGLDRMAVANQVKDAIDSKIENLKGVGSQYDTIRNNANQVKLEDNFLENQLKAMNIDVVDGKLVPNSKSKVRNTNDINALQQKYDLWKDQDILDPDEFLNFREDLDDLANYDRTSGQTRASEIASKRIRYELNQYRDQLPGLKEIDDAYESQVQPLQRWRKEFFNSDGDLKDSVLNKVANSTGKGKDPVLNRLKELVPDIEERVRLMRALEDVDYTNKGLKVGAYVRSGLGAGSLLTGNIPAALFFFATASPRNVANFVSWAGTKFPKYKNVAESAARKMQDGVKLNKEESRFVSALSKKDSKLMSQFAQTMGGIAGVGTIESFTPGPERVEQS